MGKLGIAISDARWCLGKLIFWKGNTTTYLVTYFILAFVVALHKIAFTVFKCPNGLNTRVSSGWAPLMFLCHKRFREGMSLFIR